jgi:transcriptional regulator with GAF, ATPase, and Fis domain
MVRVAQTKRPLQARDVAEDSGWPRDDAQFKVFANLTAARSFITVPMLKDNIVIGVITVYRLEPRQFTDKQAALLMNFAAQAVIAIENTRLLNELRQSLERQTATADILRVIASTPEDSKRALDTIAETAARMFNAASVHFRRIKGDVLRMIGAAGPSLLGSGTLCRISHSTSRRIRRCAVTWTIGKLLSRIVVSAFRVQSDKSPASCTRCR